MAIETQTCVACDTGARFESSRDVAKIRSNVRRFQHEEFTVWRCPDCGSLHSLEDIDYARYYDGYFIQRQKMDFYARRLFLSRLRQLTKSGISRDQKILDYGCGNGNFVHFLRGQGYQSAQGYDPFSTEFADVSVCAEYYDVVISQDVIEHAPEPWLFLSELSALVRRPGGKLAIGTPNAEHINLRDSVDTVGQLHQPYHRHILTSTRLVKLIERAGFRLDRIVDRSYVDTFWPFVNSTFLFNYMAAVDGTVDSGFDPIQLRLVLGSVKLVFYGLFGGLLAPRKDVFMIATAT